MAGGALAQPLPAVVRTPAPLIARSDRHCRNRGGDQTLVLPGIAARHKKARSGIGLFATQDQEEVTNVRSPLSNQALSLRSWVLDHAKRSVSHADNQQRVENHT